MINLQDFHSTILSDKLSVVATIKHVIKSYDLLTYVYLLYIFSNIVGFKMFSREVKT